MTYMKRRNTGRCGVEIPGFHGGDVSRVGPLGLYTG